MLLVVHCKDKKGLDFWFCTSAVHPAVVTIEDAYLLGTNDMSRITKDVLFDIVIDHAETMKEIVG